MSDLELSSHIYSYMKEDNFKQSALIFYPTNFYINVSSNGTVFLERFHEQNVRVTTRLDVKRERVIRRRVDAHDVVDVVRFALARL